MLEPANGPTTKYTTVNMAEYGQSCDPTLAPWAIISKLVTADRGKACPALGIEFLHGVFAARVRNGVPAIGLYFFVILVMDAKSLLMVVKNCSKHQRNQSSNSFCQCFLANLGMDWIEALGKTVTFCWGDHWLPLWYFSGAYCSGTALSHGRVPGNNSMWMVLGTNVVLFSKNRCFGDWSLGI